MKRKDYRCRCEKVHLEKCKGVCRTYSPIQLAYARKLEDDVGIVSFQCNVPLSDTTEGEFTTDFVCTKADGDLMVRECVYRNHLTLPRTVKLLDLSRSYWLNQGVSDWGLVINAEQ